MRCDGGAPGAVIVHRKFRAGACAALDATVSAVTTVTLNARFNMFEAYTSKIEP